MQFLSNFSSAFKKSSKYQLFFLSVLTAGLSYGLYKGVIDNYLAEAVAMTEFDKGVSEFFRELPGLLLVFILAAFYMLSAETLYKLGAVIMLAGMMMQTFVPADKAMVILAIIVYSLGDHIQLGMRTTLTLEYAREGRSGRALGYISSILQGGQLIGFLLISAAFLFVSGVPAYRAVFAVSTALIALGAAFSFRLTGRSETDRAKRRFYFRKKYTKYYFLEVFYGARKQVFFTFGPYVLILFYGASTSVISLLFAISAIFSFLFSPLIGKIIDKLGYKVVMVTDTLILVVVCFFYGFAHRIFPADVAFLVCCANYVLDSIISLASMASNVYVHDLADTLEEARATISTGLSVNHLITILIALFGGWIWRTLGIEMLFILSAVLGLCNSAYAATIKSPEENKMEVQCT